MLKEKGKWSFINFQHFPAAENTRWEYVCLWEESGNGYGPVTVNPGCT